MNVLTGKMRMTSEANEPQQTIVANATMMWKPCNYYYYL
jgi:hypothetical protein